jgi:hypothetical protein
MQETVNFGICATEVSTYFILGQCWGCSSVIQYMLNMCKALGSISCAKVNK